MKFNKVLWSAFITLGLVACNNEDEGFKNEQTGTSDIVLSIGNGLSTTRGALDGGIGNYAIKADIKKLDIYFANNGNFVQYVYSVNSEAVDNNKLAWDDLKAGKPVRFIGLTGVTKVFVVANDAENPIAVGTNITTHLEKLEKYGSDKSANQIAFIGADETLSNVAAEPAEDVEHEVTLLGSGEKGDLYVSAEVAIRPVISRLEISKIGVAVSGSKEVKIPEGDPDAGTYTVEWTGFTPQLVGIYMSNMYTSMNVIAPKIQGLFRTPSIVTGNLSKGDWVVADGNNMTPAVNNVSRYSNYVETTGYQPLFTGEPAVSGNNRIYFDGSTTNTSVPFNFLVPYDVKATSVDIEAASDIFGAQPVFHFQFKYDSAMEGAYKYTVKDSEGIEVTADKPAFHKVVTNFIYPATDGGIAFANVVDFNGDSGKLAIRPGKIYKMDEVIVSPFNLTTSTTSHTAFNVVVKVNVIDFQNVNVTPGFDKE